MNWMRAKSPPTTVANERTARVLATPGTPSSRQCPLASSETINCSTMCSWPTITRCTWAMASPSSLAASLVSGDPWVGGFCGGAATAADRGAGLGG